MTTRIKVFDLILFILFVLTIIGIGYDFLFKVVVHISPKKVDRIDWHDRKLMEQEKHRKGLGEHGLAAYLSSYPPEYKDIIDTVGYNGYLSDKIALNRSLKDLRPTALVYLCLYIHFLRGLNFI